MELSQDERRHPLPLLPRAEDRQEKFLASALFNRGGLNLATLGVCVGCGAMLLDLCGLGALGAGLGTGVLPSALAVGYSATLAAAVFLGALMAAAIDWCVGLRRGILALAVAAAVAVPYALELPAGGGSGSARS